MDSNQARDKCTTEVLRQWDPTGHVGGKRNIPQFKIHGKARRELKKKRAREASLVKNFWRCQQMDEDMAEVYGDEFAGRMDNDEAQKKYETGGHDVIGQVRDSGDLKKIIKKAVS